MIGKATKSTLAGAAIAMALAATSTAAGAQQGFKLSEFDLDNGLHVIFHEDHTNPTVSVNIWYHVGSKDEPAHRNGFAHLFEHLMFQGSKHVPEDMFFRFLERAGATHVNGTTAMNRTNYYETVPSNQLALALWLESDRMGFLLNHVDEKTFESQRSVVLNERRQSYLERPYGMVSTFIRGNLYPKGHPYHNTTIGTPEDLNSASLEDVRAFYKRFYVPNNASLVLAGDFQPEEAKQLVEKYFGPIPRKADPKVIVKKQPAGLSKSVTLHVEAGVQLPRVYVTYPSPPFFAAGDAELDGVAHVLSEGKSSRLYKRMVYEEQIAKDVTAYQASGQLASEFYIIATAAPGHTAGELLKVIDEELHKLGTTAPSEAEIERARANLESSLVFQSEQLSARADMFNRYLQYTGRPDFFLNDIQRYRALSPSNVQQAANRWLVDKPRIVALVSPNPKAPRCGTLVKGDKQ